MMLRISLRNCLIRRHFGFFLLISIFANLKTTVFAKWKFSLKMFSRNEKFETRLNGLCGWKKWIFHPLKNWSIREIRFCEICFSLPFSLRKFLANYFSWTISFIKLLWLRSSISYNFPLTYRDLRIKRFYLPWEKKTE